MAKFSKLEPVTLTYLNGRIEVKGTSIKAALVVSSGDLKSMYFGGTGHGTLNLQITETKEDPNGS